jgi:transposase
MAVMDLPAACDEVRGSEPKRAAPFSSPAKVSASLPNGVKLTLECGDVDALTAVIGALGDVQAGR